MDEGSQWERPAPSDIPGAPLCVQPKRGERPAIPKKGDIRKYSDDELVRICLWLLGDQLALSREERIDQAIPELGLQNHGKVIVDRLDRAFQRAQRIIDTGMN